VSFFSTGLDSMNFPLIILFSTPAAIFSKCRLHLWLDLGSVTTPWSCYEALLGLAPLHFLNLSAFRPLALRACSVLLMFCLPRSLCKGHSFCLKAGPLLLCLGNSHSSLPKKISLGSVGSCS
jgi:hypothetical protein